MPTKVCLFRTHYPHWGAHSGINQFVKYLDAGQYEIVQRLIPDSDENFPVRHNSIRKVLRSAVQRRGMPWYKLSDLEAELRALIPLVTGRMDILHYLDGEHSAQFLPGLLKRIGRRRPKLLATYHQPSEVLDSLIIKDVIAQLDCITVVSPEQETFFRALVPGDRVSLVPHGIDTDFFRPTDEPQRDGTLRCLTVGHYLRDFNAVRQVAQRLLRHREVEFHIVSSQALDIGDLPNIRIYTGIDDAGLLKLYQMSNILFLPLVQSTANNALLEGIACGLPVVSTRLPSVCYYLPGEEAILIENNDPDQFAETITDLLHHPEMRITMGQAARRRAEALDWRRIAAEFAVVYSSLLANN